MDLLPYVSVKGVDELRFSAMLFVIQINGLSMLKESENWGIIILLGGGLKFTITIQQSIKPFKSLKIAMNLNEIFWIFLKVFCIILYEPN